MQRIYDSDISLDVKKVNVNIMQANTNRVVHLDVEVRSEELLRQLSYTIKNQLARGFACPTLVLYGLRAPIIGPFRAL